MENQELQLVTNYTAGIKTPISKINTRHLLRIYRRYSNCFYYNCDEFEVQQRDEDLRIASIIKLELDTREHIPNRKESKLIRQREAKKISSLRNKNK